MIPANGKKSFDRIKFQKCEYCGSTFNQKEMSGHRNSHQLTSNNGSTSHPSPHNSDHQNKAQAQEELVRDFRATRNKHIGDFLVKARGMAFKEFEELQKQYIETISQHVLMLPINNR